MPPRVLVVDDDAAIRQVLADALADAGYAVEQARDGIVALELVTRQAPDLILCDVQMPYLGGIGLAAILAPHTPPIPIILMSANPVPPGCTLPCIRKPFGIEALLTLLARTLPTCSVGTVALAGLGVVED